MTKKILFLLILVFSFSFVSAETVYNYLTKPYADTLYCQLGGDCYFNSINSTTIIETTVNGSLSIEGDLNVTGCINGLNLTITDDGYYLMTPCEVSPSTEFLITEMDDDVIFNVSESAIRITSAYPIYSTTIGQHNGTWNGTDWLISLLSANDTILYNMITTEITNRVSNDSVLQTKADTATNLSNLCINNSNITCSYVNGQFILGYNGSSGTSTEGWNKTNFTNEISAGYNASFNNANITNNLYVQNITNYQDKWCNASNCYSLANFLNNTTPVEVNLSAYWNKTEVNNTINSAIPIGGIIMWSGNISTIPQCWAICNGTAGTPDLRNRFIVGANADSGGVAKTTLTGSATQTGGSVNHTHSTYIGAHNHFFELPYGGGVEDTMVSDQYDAFGYTDEEDLGSKTSGNPSTVPVPYYALAYIMRVC